MSRTALADESIFTVDCAMAFIEAVIASTPLAVTCMFSDMSAVTALCAWTEPAIEAVIS